MTGAVIIAGKNGMPPIHPGEVLKEMFLEPYNLSINKLSERMHVTTARMSEIIRGKRGITADTAARLGKVLGTSAKLWLNLQTAYDLRLLETTEIEEIENLTPFDFPEEEFA